MTYTVVFSANAQKHIEAFERSGNHSLLRKIVALKDELVDHPREGTGKPEMLKGNLYE